MARSNLAPRPFSLMDAIYRWRDVIATLPTLVVLLLLIGFGFKNVKAIKYHDDKPVEVQLTAPPVVPQSEPEPPKPETPKPVPQTHSTPVPQTVAPVATTSSPSPVAAPAEPEKPQPVQPPAPPAVAAPVVTPAPPAPPRPVAADMQSEYIAKVKAQLNAIKRYPTGREASQLHPKGTVTLWFVLKRDGSLVDSGVEESSNSSLLDEAARKTLNRASFPAFPEQTWSGESTHRFVAELNFIPPN